MLSGREATQSTDERHVEELSHSEDEVNQLSSGRVSPTEHENIRECFAENQHQMDSFELEQVNLILGTDFEEALKRAEHIPAGGSSDVYRVPIHDSDNDGVCEVSHKPREIAVKRFRSGNPASFYDKELASLKLLQQTANPFITPLLANLKHQGEAYLLFPWAERGCLDDMLRTEPPMKSPDTVRWLLRQLLGLSDALKDIHNPLPALFGRHGNLKPESILWFMDDEGPQGTLKISDFGLTTFSSSAEQTIGDTFRFNATYRPPEIDMTSRKEISGSADIWSLGCIFLEIVVWQLYGFEAVESGFSSARIDMSSEADFKEDTFFCFIEHKDLSDDEEQYAFTVNPAVTKWIDNMHENPRTPMFLHDLLDLVQNHMLIVDQSRRVSAEGLVSCLRTMESKADLDLDYFTVPSQAGFSISKQSPAVEDESEMSKPRVYIKPTKSGSQLFQLKAKKPSQSGREPSPLLGIILEAPNMLLTPLKPSRSTALYNRARAMAETFLPGNILVWFPSANHDQQSRLSWTYGNKQLSLTLDAAEADLLRNYVRKVPAPHDILPQHTREGQALTDLTNQVAFQTHLGRAFAHLARWWNHRNQEGPAAKGRNKNGKEIPEEKTETFLTTARLWSGQKRNILRSISLDNLQDDSELFIQARKALEEVLGQGWMKSMFWRAYTNAELTMFMPLPQPHFKEHSFVFVLPYGAPGTENKNPIKDGYLPASLFPLNTDATTTINADASTNPVVSNQSSLSHHSPAQESPGSVDDSELRLVMAYIGENILYGLNEPTRGRGEKTVLELVLRRKSPPVLEMKPLTWGWCFHVDRTLHWKRVMRLGAVLVALGLAFVPFWLCFVDEKDLQTAFVPASWTMALFGVVVGTLALEG